MGCPSDARRAPEVGDRGESIDRGQIHATAFASTVPDLAHLSDQSRKPDHGRRPFRRADGHLPAPLRPHRARARPSTTRARGSHRASDGGLDRTTTPQCLFGERCATISPPRSRFGLCRGGRHVKDTPITRPIAPPSGGPIVAIPEVGGLHYRYDRVAA